MKNDSPSLTISTTYSELCNDFSSITPTKRNIYIQILHTIKNRGVIHISGNDDYLVVKYRIGKPTIAKFLDKHLSTIKRGVSELQELGYLNLHPASKGTHRDYEILVKIEDLEKASLKGKKLFTRCISCRKLKAQKGKKNDDSLYIHNTYINNKKNLEKKELEPVGGKGISQSELLSWWNENYPQSAIPSKKARGIFSKLFRDHGSFLSNREATMTYLERLKTITWTKVDGFRMWITSVFNLGFRDKANNTYHYQQNLERKKTRKQQSEEVNLPKIQAQIQEDLAKDTPFMQKIKESVRNYVGDAAYHSFFLNGKFKREGQLTYVKLNQSWMCDKIEMLYGKHLCRRDDESLYVNFN